MLYNYIVDRGIKEIFRILDSKVEEINVVIRKLSNNWRLVECKSGNMPKE